MTNYLGIATVTEIIRQMLEGEIIGEVDQNCVVLSTTPDKAGVVTGKPYRMNLFLYHVTPNTGYRNIDLPMRDTAGSQFVKNPLIALDLHYLLTAYSENPPNNDTYAQLMLASSMRALEENSILTRDRIAKLRSIGQSPFDKTDLDTQVEVIKISIENLTLEEISKLWSSFFQLNYRLSVFYKATVILLEGKKKPTQSLPVQERFVYTSPQFTQPFIEKVEPQISDLSSTQIKLTGRNLLSDGVVVMLNEISQIPASYNVTDNQIIVDIPNTVTAGKKDIKIINSHMLDSSQNKEKINLQSNIVPFVLAPMITDGTTAPTKSLKAKPGENLTINFQPAVGPNQKVSVVIGSKIFSESSIKINTPPKSLSLTIPADFKADTYLVRLIVDEVGNLKSNDTNLTVTQ